MSRRIPAVLVSVLFAASLFLTAHARPAPAPAPAIDVRTATGRVTLESLKGRVVVLDFWASWCAPCQRSFPWLENLQQRHAEKGLTVLAINLDKNAELADRFLADHPVHFTIGYDPSGRSAEAMHVGGMPSTYVIGRDGTVRYRHVGFDPRKTAALESAVQEACRP